MDDLLQQGITAYKAGKRDEARKIFITVVKQNPNEELAWKWMYNVSGNDKESEHCLKQILRINPKNEKANQLLSQMLATPYTSNPSPMKNWEDLDKHTFVLQKSYDELCQRHNTLQSFRDAREWDNDTSAFIVLLQNLNNDWIVYRKEQEDKLEQLQQERNNKSFINRVLSTKSDEEGVMELIKQIDVEINGNNMVIDSLNEMMDKTPANKSEQKEIADVIIEVKKELTLKKREVNENLRQTRVNARQKTANWTGSNPGLLGTVARYQRTTIRLEKERALVPMENLKTFIEGKLIILERDLNWVMHFKGDDQESKNLSLQEEINPEQLQRCKYCGRRVNDVDDICKGCGAAV